MGIGKVTYIDEAKITDKRVLLRVDFNVSLTEELTIADDARIRQALPTILTLLRDKNRLILVSHLGRPEGRDPKLSLKVVARHLQTFLDGYKVTLVDDFETEEGKRILAEQQNNEIMLLENIRFYKGEKSNAPDFAKELASLADIYVNDAFGVSHRTDASVVGVSELIPPYGGLLLKREIEMISKIIHAPQKPFVAILGGAKISTKINLIENFIGRADYLIIGGAMANVFLHAQGHDIGKSFCEYDETEKARKLLFLAAQRHTVVVLPSDVMLGNPDDTESAAVNKKIDEIEDSEQILDIGPESQAQFGSVIAKAKTLIWNGPVGYFENPLYRIGTDFIYYSIAQNHEALSIVGGGDTLAAISKKEYLDSITHISTGGGAMLEFIEKGTLPGIEALKK